MQRRVSREGVERVRLWGGRQYGRLGGRRRRGRNGDGVEYRFRCSMWALRRERRRRSRERSLWIAEVVGKEEGEGRASIARV